MSLWINENSKIENSYSKKLQEALNRKGKVGNARRKWITLFNEE